MKNILVPVILLVSLQLHAQSDTSGIQFIELSDSTGFGAPNGKLVSSQIGTAGGKIVSDDGRVELIFPAGSLSGTTAISIQPTTNLLDSAAGNSYRFEPSGIQFKKPVQIIFHYSNEEDETCPADLMAFGLQDDKGKWTTMEYDQWDSTNKILKGYIQHFSHFTNIFQIELKTDHAVMVNEKTFVGVFIRGAIIKSGDLKGQQEVAILNPAVKREWFANGVAGGNNFEGWIEDGITVPGKGSLKMNGMYRAPWFFPKKNPVTIGLGLRYWSKKTGDWAWRICSCKIIVFDAYEVWVTHGATGRVGMGAQINDAANFVVAIFPKKFLKNIVSVEQIKNYTPVVVKHGRSGPFRETISVDGAEGSIHITDEIKTARLSGDYPPKVHFEFVPHEVLWHTAQYKAPGVKIEPVPIRCPPIPPVIDFIANGLEQIYELKTYVMAQEETYQLSIKPLSK